MLRSVSFRFLAPLGLLVVSAQMTPLWALQLGGRPAEEWALTLESGRRLGRLEIDEVVARMALQPGDVVADVGVCGHRCVLGVARASRRAHRHGLGGRGRPRVPSHDRAEGSGRQRREHPDRFWASSRIRSCPDATSMWPSSTMSFITSRGDRPTSRRRRGTWRPAAASWSLTTVGITPGRPTATNPNCGSRYGR